MILKTFICVLVYKMSEGVYLIQPREFIKSNENVYKLGRSIHLDNRVKQYPNGSNTLLMLNCNNSIACEKYLINLFKTKFTQKTYYGTEYFEGDKKMMIREIIKYITSVYDKEDAEDKVNNNAESVVEVVALVSGKCDEKGDGKVKKDKEKVVKDKVVKEKVVKDKIVKEKVNSCKKCNKIFQYPSLLKRHFKLSSRCSITDDEINLFFNPKVVSIKCNKCDKDFTRKTSLLRHQSNIKCNKSKV